MNEIGGALDPTTRFGPRALDYAAFRPTYPGGAVDAVLDGLGAAAELTIADVGAGTGISSRLFAQRVAHVIAIEPNARMRAAAQSHRRVSWHEGTAEQTGLPDQSVEAIVACQAFHWFANEDAIHEFRRVARRRAALLQYERDEEDPFTKAYGEVVRAFATDDTEALRRNGLTIFEDFPEARVTRRVFSGKQQLDREALLGRAASASYLPRSGPRAKALRRELAAIFESFANGGTVELALLTFVILADW